VKTADELIRIYLQDLKAELKGSDKATVQDALADAEEHLRTALENAEADAEAEAEAVQAIIAEYGEAEEIAEAYKNWEVNLPPALAATPAARRVSAASANGTSPAAKTYSGFFGVYADPRTWGGLVFMLISIITGTLYFSWAVTGLSTSLGVMILIIGIPVTILFLLSFRGIAFLEGRLVEALLGERMPRRASFTDSSLPWRERLKILLTGKATWLSWLYMILMLPIGIIYFTVAVTLIAIAVSFIASPAGVIYMIVNNLPVSILHTQNYSWVLTPSQAVLFSMGLAALGVGIATVTMHIARFVGRIHGKFAKALLVSD
jgi:uncharacterized membrane protein